MSGSSSEQKPRCGYTVVDRDGEEGPCNGLATWWRWYQDVEHEDSLDVACSLHQNEGGQRLHAAETERDRLAHALAEQEIAYAGLEQTYLAVSDAHAALVDKVSALAAEAIR